MLLFGALHLVALALGAVLFVMFLRSETVTPWKPPEDEDGGGGGGNDRIGSRPKGTPPGGVPLPDAEQSRVRLREPGRLADAHPWPRRREHEPQRTPERVS